MSIGSKRWGDGSFIEVMEELYERVRTKSPEMK